MGEGIYSCWINCIYWERERRKGERWLGLYDVGREVAGSYVGSLLDVRGGENREET